MKPGDMAQWKVLCKQDMSSFSQLPENEARHGGTRCDPSAGHMGVSLQLDDESL